MKKGWLGVGLLAVFLAAGLALSFWMDKTHLPGSQLLQQAAEVTLQGDLEQGITLARRAEALWENSREATATVADHGPMEEIDGLFRELWVYAQMQETPHFAATSAELALKIRAVADAHRISWSSLL